MKYNLLLTSIICVLKLQAQFSSVVWQFSGMSSSEVVSIQSTTANLIFAGTNQGLFRSNDDGLSWTNITALDMGNKIRTIFITPNSNIYVGTKAGLYYSSNIGNSWTKVYTSSTLSDVRSIFVDKNSRIFISVIDSSVNLNDRSVFLSNNNGSSWSKIDSGIIGYSRVKSFNTDTIGNIYGLAGEGLILYDILYKWNDDSLKWLIVSNFPGSLVVNEIKNLSNNNFIASTSDGMFFSINSGIGWTSNGLYPKPCISLDVSNIDEILVGTSYSGAYFSIDAGTNWLNNQITIPRNPFVTGSYPDPLYSIHKSSSGRIFLGTRDSGIYRSNLVLSLNNFFKESKSILIYPNPSINNVHIDASSIIKEIIIYDEIGQEQKRVAFNKKNIILDVSTLSSGVYGIRIEFFDTGFIKGKIVKLNSD